MLSGKQPFTRTLLVTHSLMYHL